MDLIIHLADKMNLIYYYCHVYLTVSSRTEAVLTEQNEMQISSTRIAPYNTWIFL